MEDLLIGTLRKNPPKISESMDVGYFSGGGPTTYKLFILLLFPAISSIIIAASQSRGVDHGVGLNFTPTVTI